MAWGFPKYVEIVLQRPSFRTHQVGETIHWIRQWWKHVAFQPRWLAGAKVLQLQQMLKINLLHHCTKTMRHLRYGWELCSHPRHGWGTINCVENKGEQISAICSAKGQYILLPIAIYCCFSCPSLFLKMCTCCTVQILTFWLGMWLRTLYTLPPAHIALQKYR